MAGYAKAYRSECVRLLEINNKMNSSCTESLFIGGKNECIENYRSLSKTKGN